MKAYMIDVDLFELKNDMINVLSGIKNQPLSEKQVLIILKLIDEHGVMKLKLRHGDYD